MSVLDELDTLLGRYVVFPHREAQAAVALWIVHCHALDAFESTPRLALLSPERETGKSRTLEVLTLLVPEPIHTVNISAAALFRMVDDRQPTLLMDEADTYLGRTTAKAHEDLRGLINAGHRRGAKAYRGEVSGKAVKVADFSAFAACALAGIGDLPDTILDRAVIVSMKRRAEHEPIEPFRERLARPGAEQIRDRVAQWAAHNVNTLRDAFPEMPVGIVDRVADVWEPLIAIADLAGGEWPELAREAAVKLYAERRRRDPSFGVLLLTDCRTVFDARGVDRLTSKALVEALLALEESSWANLKGKPLDTARVARTLKPYDVRPATHRFGAETHRGYLREDFHDAWARYLVTPVTPDTGVTPVTPVTPTPSDTERKADTEAVLHLQGELEGPSLLANGPGALSLPEQVGVIPVTPVTAEAPPGAGTPGYLEEQFERFEDEWITEEQWYAAVRADREARGTP
jgi:hypothetical protein